MLVAIGVVVQTFPTANPPTITRKGRDTTGFGAEISSEVATFDTYKSRVSYGNKYRNGLELFLSGSIYESAGNQDLFYKEFLGRDTNGTVHNADADSYKSFFGSVAFHDFSLEGGFITHKKVNPTAQFLTDFNDSRLRTIDDRSYADLKYANFPDLIAAQELII